MFQIPDYFPSLDEVVNFRLSYWEDKLFSKRTVGNSILASLRPEGMISMRLGNPTKTDF